MTKLGTSTLGDQTAAAPPLDGRKVMGKRELIDRVVAKSGIKKSAAKTVIEAVLREMGDAFSRGETVNLQPFGKGTVRAGRALETADVIDVRLRRPKPSADGGDGTGPLAKAAE